MLSMVVMNCGSSFLLLAWEFLKGKEENRWNGKGMCHDQWKDTRTLFWLYILLSLPLVS